MSLESKQERRAMRDRFAIGAMQSLIQNYAIIDREGWSQSMDPSDPNSSAFRSIAGEALRFGDWGSALQGKSSTKQVLAYEAYEIAEAMMDMRSEVNSGEDYHEEKTEEPKSAANQSRRDDDGGRILEFPSVEPSSCVAQVGSEAASVGERSPSEPE